MQKHKIKWQQNKGFTVMVSYAFGILLYKSTVNNLQSFLNGQTSFRPYQTRATTKQQATYRVYVYIT